MGETRRNSVTKVGWVEQSETQRQFSTTDSQFPIPDSQFPITRLVEIQFSVCRQLYLNHHQDWDSNLFC